MQDYHTSTGNPLALASDTGDVGWAKAKKGIETALTHYSGSSDPSSGASPAWGATEVGRLWLDTTVAASPSMKMWQQLTAAGPTYGWRLLRGTRTKWLEEPVDILASGDVTSDVADTAIDLTTILNGAGVQDDASEECLVTAVYVRVRCKETGTIPSTDDVWIEVKKKGATAGRRVYPQVAGRLKEDSFWVALDSGEELEYAIDVAGASPTFTRHLQILGFQEAW